jgi:hypothetical protein
MPLDPQTHNELMLHFIDELDFMRMLALEAQVTEVFTTYEDLKQWTAECLNDSSLGHTQFLIEFARLSSQKVLNGTDMECCAEFIIQGFYYNAKREMCLTMPR